ncbi:MAG TPA: flagellar hook-length control protein FliK [Cellvibrio sp.]|nr:flagellar hook-length control protein FliK [Cellvibrio sp.]
MNNGNLLNGLLGITNANAGATKTATAKARAQSSEKFQQAFEQARPEVAARKPVSRKDNSATAAPERARAQQKPVADHHKRAETKTAEVPVDDKKSVAKGLTTNTNTTADDAEADTTARVQAGVVEGQESDAQDEGDIVLLDPALIDPGLAPVAESVAGLLIADEASALTSLDATSEEDVPDLSVKDGLEPWVVANPLAALHGVIEDSAAGQPADIGLINGPNANLQAVNSQAVVQPSGDILANKTSAGLMPDAIATDFSADGELSTATETVDTGDNPDFLLLNSKAAFNKLAETNMAANPLDKAAPAAELAKPAVTPALESLARLSEAQSPAARAFVVQTGVPATVGSPQWSQAVGDKVLWLAAQNVSAAEIRLDPPELGAMQVKVSVNQDQTSISFVSPHPAVREALDQQLHRLREMFSDQGLNLVNVDVSDKSFAQQQREQDDSARNQGVNELVDEELAPVAVTQAVSMRLVDHYA